MLVERRTLLGVVISMMWPRARQRRDGNARVSSERHQLPTSTSSIITPRRHQPCFVPFVPSTLPNGSAWTALSGAPEGKRLDCSIAGLIGTVTSRRDTTDEKGKESWACVSRSFGCIITGSRQALACLAFQLAPVSTCMQIGRSVL